MADVPANERCMIVIVHTVAAIGGCFVALQQSVRKDKCVSGHQMGPETKSGLRRLEILVE